MYTADGLEQPDLEQRVHNAIMTALRDSKHDLVDVFLALNEEEAAYYLVYVLPVLRSIN
jgi:hypothetical protein